MTEQFSYATENNQWDKYVAKLQVAGNPLSMAFHAYDNLLVVANESDMIGYVSSASLLIVCWVVLSSSSVWDWPRKKRLRYFCNGNPTGTSITSLEIINQDVGGILMTGSGTYYFPNILKCIIIHFSKPTVSSDFIVTMTHRLSRDLFRL